MTMTIGADPEFFLGKEGQFVCAHGLFPGTKYEPHPVKDGSIQVDGVAAEFNTLPCKDFHEFKTNIETVMSELKQYVPEYEFLTSSTVLLDTTIISPDALALSCAPDFDPYSEEMNQVLDQEAGYRSAGGHIHIGDIFSEGMNGQQKYKTAIRLARLMDKYVGVYSLLWDKDDVRRSTYGKAGNCRIKSYGVEYRALSNAWLFNDKIMEFVWRQTEKAVQALRNDEDGEVFYRNLINNIEYDHEFFNTDPTAQELKTYV